jgi:hypothetical protein
MSTLHAANMALIDAEQRLSRILQFNEDLKRQARETFAALRCGLDQMEAQICNGLDTQSRDIAAAMGSGKPQPETVDHHPDEPAQPKLVKPKAA